MDWVGVPGGVPDDHCRTTEDDGLPPLPPNMEKLPLKLLDGDRKLGGVDGDAAVLWMGRARRRGVRGASPPSVLSMAAAAASFRLLVLLAGDVMVGPGLWVWVWVVVVVDRSKKKHEVFFSPAETVSFQDWVTPLTSPQFHKNTTHTPSSALFVRVFFFYCGLASFCCMP